MKRIYRFFLITLLISVFNFSNAQNREYVPMLNEESKWIETMWATTWPPSPWGYNYVRHVSVNGDTLINNQLYSRLYSGMVDVFCQDSFSFGPDYIAAMRENIDEQKVWIIESGETEEQLYFDYTLGIGDTVPENSYFDYYEDLSPIVVFDIDTITSFDGLERKKWVFEPGPGASSEVVEGIGSIHGVLTPYFVFFEYFEDLYCFTIDTTQVYPFDIPFDCILPSDTCLTVGTYDWPNQSESGQFITAYPVPAKDFVYLQFDAEIQQDKVLLQIIDFTGKIVYSKMIGQNQSNVEKINIINMPAGIYIATIQNNGRMEGKCKFVVE